MSEQALEIVVEEKLNYYNYFTEVEEAFVSRRGAPMLISPLDWALIESWKEMGIPLHIVLRGIIKSFEHYRAEASRGKRVNTLFYCQQEVLSNFKDYVESQVGASTTTAAASTDKQTAAATFPKQELLNFINNRNRDLTQAHKQAIEKSFNHLKESLARAIARLSEIASDLSQANTISAESLERDLTLLEEIIFESLQKDVPPAELTAIHTEAEQQLRPHKKRMESSVYQQTLDNYVAKRLREHHFIPRLSLFYM